MAAAVSGASIDESGALEKTNAEGGQTLTIRGQPGMVAYWQWSHGCGTMGGMCGGVLDLLQRRDDGDA